MAALFLYILVTMLEPKALPIHFSGETLLSVMQGAFMAALYAQGLPWEEMKLVVRQYATQMGSVGQLVRDITLPLISLFSGAGFDRVVRQSMANGPQYIEDLWLRYDGTQTLFPCLVGPTSGFASVDRQAVNGRWELQICAA